MAQCATVCNVDVAHSPVSKPQSIPVPLVAVPFLKDAMVASRPTVHPSNPATPGLAELYFTRTIAPLLRYDSQPQEVLVQGHARLYAATWPACACASQLHWLVRSPSCPKLPFF